MAEWARETPWRQGQALSDETAKAFGLAHPETPAATVVVVVSHDCDLAQLPQSEPAVEAIVGRFIDAADGNCTHAKNVRRLHIAYARCADNALIEMTATAKIMLPKAELADHLPRGDLHLAANEHSILQRWLAARYRRAAFPDEFDKRLDNSGMKERLSKILKPLGQHIPAVFFDVDEGRDIKRNGPGDTYTLDIYLLHTTEPDSAKAETAANEARKQIEAAFKSKLFEQGKGWQQIELRECSVISDEAMTYKQSTLLTQWRLEHISLRADPPQPMMEANNGLPGRRPA